MDGTMEVHAPRFIFSRLALQPPSPSMSSHRKSDGDDQLRGQLRGLFDAIPDAVWLKDGQGRWLAVNAPALKLFELEGVDYWGKDERELCEYSEKYREALLSCIDTDERAWKAGGLTHIAETLPLEDGTIGVYDLIKVPLFHEDGSRKGLVAIGRDITAQRRAEEARDRLYAQEQAARKTAEDAERRASLLAEASRLLSSTSDPASAMVDLVALVVPWLADACVVELEGAATNSARPERITSGAVPSDASVRDRIVAPIVAHDRTYGTIAFVSATEVFPAATRDLCLDLAQRIALSVANARLIAELRASHEALAKAQEANLRRERLAALGQLAAVVAHEVRNPLAAIYNSLGSLKKMQLFGGDAAVLFGVVEEEASRLNRLVTELLDFVRPFHPNLDEHALSPVIDAAVGGALRAHTNADLVRTSRRIAPSLPRVELDAHLMHIALINVLSNALQAMPKGGSLDVVAEPVQLPDGTFAEIAITDTGAGIPQEQLDHVFDPFFTTRPSGTGLGLAIVRRIVDSHGGHVEAKSRPGSGATILIRLPLQAPKKGARELRHPDDEPSHLGDLDRNEASTRH